MVKGRRVLVRALSSALFVLRRSIDKRGCRVIYIYTMVTVLMSVMGPVGLMDGEYINKSGVYTFEINTCLCSQSGFPSPEALSSHKSNKARVKCEKW